MEAKELSPSLTAYLAGSALGLVLMERKRQVEELGYTPDHDDRHQREEIAAAAAFFLIPQLANQDVCTCTADYGLVVQSLSDLIGESALEGLDRDDYEDAGILADVQIDTRIGQLVKGVALGLAELERWLRARALRPPGSCG